LSKSKRVTIMRLAGFCGLTNPVIVFMLIALSISYSPWFSWTENALSDLGVHGIAAILFNSGLIIGGVLAITFAIGLRDIAAQIASPCRGSTSHPSGSCSMRDRSIPGDSRLYSLLRFCILLYSISNLAFPYRRGDDSASVYEELGSARGFGWLNGGWSLGTSMDQCCYSRSTFISRSIGMVDGVRGWIAEGSFSVEKTLFPVALELSRPLLWAQSKLLSGIRDCQARKYWRFICFYWAKR